MRDSLTLDVVLLVVQGEEDLCDKLELLDFGVGEGGSPSKKTNYMSGRNWTVL